MKLLILLLALPVLLSSCGTTKAPDAMEQAIERKCLTELNESN